MIMNARSHVATTAGLLLAVGLCSEALASDGPPAAVPTTPASSVAPETQAKVPPLDGYSIVPLGVFDLSPGQQLSVGDVIQIADGHGLSLPLGKRVDLSWQKDGAQFHYQVINIDASTGPMVPDWAVAGSTIQPDGNVVAVGRGYGRSVGMAVSRAMMDARMEAATTRSGQTTTDVTVQVNGAGTQRSESVRTTVNGGVSSQTTDQVITVCADPAHAPAIPLKPGTEHRLSARPGNLPVRCWVRVSAQVKPPIEAAQRTSPAPANADKEFGALDAEIDQELKGKLASAPTPK